MEMLMAAHDAARKAEVERDLKKLADMRAKNAERQRRYRARKLTADNVTRRDAALQKENPPDPRKKNTNPPVPKGTSPRPREARDYPLPDWVPLGPWEAFAEVRRRKRQPLTVAAIRLLVERLGEFRRQGLDPADVLNHSVENGWGSLRQPHCRQAKAVSVRAPMTADELERAAQYREDIGDPGMAARYREQLRLLRTKS